MIKTIITTAIIVAYRGKNNIKCSRKITKTNKQINKTSVVGGGGGEVNREQNN